MTALHARLAPSAAHRWGPGGCPGSVALESAHPEEGESEAAREGTAAHWYLTEQFRDGGEVHPLGALAPNGVPVTREMVDGAVAITEDVLAARPEASDTAQLVVEMKLPPSPRVHDENWGTPDFFLIDWDTSELTVWDYKFGHRYVDAFRNWQMMNYAMLILSWAGVEHWHKWRITLKIAQPRNYSHEGPLRSWYLSGAQLAENAEMLRGAAVLAVQAGAPLRTGEHCRDCKAAHVCPALQRSAMNAVDISHKQSNVDMPAAALGLELSILDAAAKRLDARRDALEAHALGIIARGGNVPAWQRTHVKGRARWSQDVVSVCGLGDLYGVRLLKPPETITPAQAIKAGIPAEIVSVYSDTPSGAAKLVAVDERDAAKVFG